MEYKMHDAPRKFHCKECNNNVSLLIWKTISNNLNGYPYKCKECWKKFDDNLEYYVMKKKE